MQLIDGAKRLLGSVAVALAPLLMLVLPPLVLPGGDATSAEEQNRLFVEEGFPFEGLVMQVSGAILLIPAVLWTASVVLTRRRGVVLAVMGSVVGLVGALALLLVLGVELGQAYVLTRSSDEEFAVALVTGLGQWPPYGALLGIGLAGFLLALPLLALALWRSRIVPVMVPALFLVPVLIAFVPLPPVAANLVPSFALLLPCAWMTVQLLRRVSLSALTTQRERGQTTDSAENLSSFEAPV